ncbi:MAG: lysophospholipid acyltransferase family protein [Polyangiaceae bacterium]
MARRIEREVRRMSRIVGFGALTGAMVPGFVAHEALTAKDRRDRVRERWVSAWCSALLEIFGVRVIADGMSPSPRTGGRLVVVNHRSTADILVLLRAFGGHMVSRADLANWPLVGAAARAVGTVFVERGDALSGATALRLIRSHLIKGSTIIVFPEGTTFADDEVQPFQAGAFVAALHSGADIIPVGLAYEAGSGAAFVNESFPAHLARMAAAPPSRVAMCMGPAIVTDESSRAAQLRDVARSEVQRLVANARRIVDG